MPYVSSNYRNNAAAPVGKWVCTRTSAEGIFASVPEQTLRSGPNFCGQCVSYPTKVCPDLPVNTRLWGKGAQVKDNANIAEGTVIATFNSEGRYLGHAAIYVSQDKTKGIKVFDQWVNGIPRPIHERDIKWDGGPSVSNKGDAFYVVEPT